jgi:HTH-type transcriptional regulator / antitoxin HigA
MSETQVEKAINSWNDVSSVLYVPHTEAEYEALVKVLDKLIDAVGEDETHPLASFMEIVGVLIEKYEDENIPEL